MSEMPTAAQGTPVQSLEYDPFDKNAARPSQRYWIDRGVWGAYQASLFLTIQAERSRCSKILQTYAETAPTDVRAKLFELIKHIEFPELDGAFTAL
jgi:hypothetical protein